LLFPGKKSSSRRPKNLWLWEALLINGGVTQICERLKIDPRHGLPDGLFSDQFG
jgi:hypothetical protein